MQPFKMAVNEQGIFSWFKKKIPAKKSKMAFQTGRQWAGHIFMIFPKKMSIFPSKFQKQPFKMPTKGQGIFSWFFQKNFSQQNVKSGLSKWPPTGRAYFFLKNHEKNDWPKHDFAPPSSIPPPTSLPVSPAAGCSLIWR